MTIKIKTSRATSSAQNEPTKPVAVAAQSGRKQPKWLALVLGNAKATAAGSGAPNTREEPGADPLLVFGAEREIVAGAPRSKPARTKPARTASVGPLRVSLASGIAVAAVVVGVAVVALVRTGWPLSAATPPAARLRVETRPAGAELIVDGVARGNTPLTLALAAGEHRLIVRRGTAERVMPVVLTSGAEVTHYLELAPIETNATRTGTISVMSDPSGAKVVIDGQLRGVSPLTWRDATPVEHKVVVSNEAGSAERTVSVQAAATTTVVFTLPKAKATGPIVGWLAVSAPFDVQVIEGDAVIGVGKATRIMLTAGRHEIALSSEALGYQDKRIVDVGAGKATTVRLEAPRRTINANARPWADVFIDGVSVGQTPISNLALTIGPHDVVFRHPQLGEQSQTVVVTMQGPNRIAADLTKK